MNFSCAAANILSFSLCDCIQKNSFERHHFLSLARYAYYAWAHRWMDRIVIMRSQGGDFVADFFVIMCECFESEEMKSMGSPKYHNLH